MAKVTSFSYPDDDDITAAIIDKWEKQGKFMKSQKIRKAIKMLHEDEEKGNKLSEYFPQQSKLDILKVGELWSRDQIRMQRPEDIFELLKITIQNLQTLKEEAAIINTLK